AAQRRLAAPRLADEAERLAWPDVEVHIVDRLDVADHALQKATPDREVLLDPADFQERLVSILAGERWAGNRGCAHDSPARVERTEVWRRPPSHSQQAAVWPPTSNSGGSSTHFSKRRLQRGANRQPGGQLTALGTVPRMTASFAADVMPRWGIERRRPSV